MPTASRRRRSTTPDLVTLGAGHFHGGCAFCHGAPGVPAGPVADGMLPPPPDLATQMRPWRDRELFWIVKHGIKYTGMPAWPAQQRDDEVWALVAFLRRLPALDADGYRALALGDLQMPPQSGRELATSETASAAVGACARCHGDERNAPASALVPILHGQPVEFLAARIAGLCGRAPRQRHHAAGRERSRPATERDRVARYYAGLQAPARPLNIQPAATAAIERGRLLAEQGDAGARIPACAGCHGADALKTYPRLAGQNARLHGEPAAAVERRARARHRRRSHHGADRTRAERAPDRGCRGVFRRARQRGCGAAR